MQHAFDDFKKGAEPEKTTKHFQGLSGAVKGFGESVNQIAEPALSSFGIRAGLSAAAVTASVIGLTKAVTTYARGVVEMKDSAAIMNMSTGSVQQWDRAMKAVGIEDGVKSMQDFSVELLKIKSNVGDVAQDWQNRGLGRLFGQVQNAARLGDTNKALELMYDHLQKLQEIDPAKAEVFAQWWQHQSAAKLLQARELKQSMGPVDAAQAERDAQQAEKLNRSMQEFTVSWGRFYDRTMNYLVPGINDMIKGMTAGFEKMPEYADRFLNSPAGKLLAKVLEAAVPKVEDTPKPIPQLPAPAATPEDEAKAQYERDVKGGVLPAIVRGVQEIGDVVTTGGVKRRTETHDIHVPINEWASSAFQGPSTNEAGGAGDPFGSAAWSSLAERPEGRPDAVAPPTYFGEAGVGGELKVDNAIPDISKLLTPRGPSMGEQLGLNQIPTGDDVKEGAKQGIIDGLTSYFQSRPTPDAAQRLNVTQPTADVKRSVSDMQAAAASMAQPDDQKPVARVVEAQSKPGLEQETKSGDLARRIQQSAADVQIDLQQKPPSDAMRLLQDPMQEQQDQTVRDLLLQQPQAMPSVDQITQALASNKVEGSATLKVDIASPAGTRVNVDADGLFRQTEVSRRRAQQMEKTAFNDGFE
jgi:hypothetical protein